MDETVQRRISDASTFFNKYIFPAIWLGGALAWTIGVSFFGGINHGPPSPAVGCIGLVMFGGGLHWFVRYHFPLKEVWLGQHGVRAANFRDSVVIPFGAIGAVEQLMNSNHRYVTVTLEVDTPFGRRFTFLPANPKLTWWPFSRGEDEVVLELRDRVEAARKGKGGKHPTHPGRSPMADDELDGPL